MCEYFILYYTSTFSIGPTKRKNRYKEIEAKHLLQIFFSKSNIQELFEGVPPLLYITCIVLFINYLQIVFLPLF